MKKATKEKTKLKVKHGIDLSVAVLATTVVVCAVALVSAFGLNIAMPVMDSNDILLCYNNEFDWDTQKLVTENRAGVVEGDFYDPGVATVVIYNNSSDYQEGKVKGQIRYYDQKQKISGNYYKLKEAECTNASPVTAGFRPVSKARSLVKYEGRDCPSGFSSYDYMGAICQQWGNCGTGYACAREIVYNHSCTMEDVNGDGAVNIIDTQTVMNATLSDFADIQDQLIVEKLMALDNVYYNPVDLASDPPDDFFLSALELQATMNCFLNDFFSK